MEMKTVPGFQKRKAVFLKSLYNLKLEFTISLGFDARDLGLAFSFLPLANGQMKTVRGFQKQQTVGNQHSPAFHNNICLTPGSSLPWFSKLKIKEQSLKVKLTIIFLQWFSQAYNLFYLNPSSFIFNL
jgi:hypothetical protein